jgi:hypothetical protein
MVARVQFTTETLPPIRVKPLPRLHHKEPTPFSGGGVARWVGTLGSPSSRSHHRIGPVGEIDDLIVETFMDAYISFTPENLPPYAPAKAKEDLNHVF